MNNLNHLGEFKIIGNDKKYDLLKCFPIPSLAWPYVTCIATKKLQNNKRAFYYRA